ncbi:hypothetical protein BJ165DRAFT_1558253 [Panaeolus papilionaceus]|nr:hypothetical protein BJ165DRAFT_1558253 [Panaeolus papilionaceus]
MAEEVQPTNIELATVFGLAKRHILAAKIRSTFIFRTIIEKRGAGLTESRKQLAGVAKRLKAGAHTLPSLMKRKDSRPLPPIPKTSSDDDFDISSIDETDESGFTCALTVVSPTDSEDDDEPRGRAPEVPPKPFGYKTRYSVGLRGLTPSPTRESSSSEHGSGEDGPLPRARCSKQWRNSKRCATPPPLRHGLRRVDRRLPEAPRAAIILLEKKSRVDYEPLPLEGQGWIDIDDNADFSLYGYIPFELTEGTDPDASWDSSMTSDL